MKYLTFAFTVFLSMFFGVYIGAATFAACTNVASQQSDQTLALLAGAVAFALVVCIGTYGATLQVKSEED